MLENSSIVEFSSNNFSSTSDKNCLTLLFFLNNVFFNKAIFTFMSFEFGFFNSNILYKSSLV